MILDSCYIIDLMKGDDSAVAKLDELTMDATPLSISSLTVVEVGYGLDSAEKQMKFSDLVNDIEVVSFGKNEAKRSTQILRRLKSQGEQIGKIDSMIAATAIERDTKVLTKNLSDFNRIEEVKLAPY